MEGYLVMNWLHILAAGLVLGLLAVYPMLPAGLPRGEEARTVQRHMLRFLNVTNNLLLVPAIVVLFATGVLMTVGPYGEWTVLGREGNWIILGMALWVVVAGIVGGAMFGLVKEMVSLVERERLDEARLDRLWRQFRWAFLAGVIVTVITFWEMVFKPVF